MNRFWLRLRLRLDRRHGGMACRAAVELMTDYLEGAMTSADRARFERHLGSCSACVAYLGQMRATIAAAGHLRPDDLPAPVLDELLVLYRRHRRS